MSVLLCCSRHQGARQDFYPKTCQDSDSHQQQAVRYCKTTAKLAQRCLHPVLQQR